MAATVSWRRSVSKVSCLTGAMSGSASSFATNIIISAMMQFTTRVGLLTDAGRYTVEGITWGHKPPPHSCRRGEGIAMRVTVLCAAARVAGFSSILPGLP